jgi:Zn-dependent peptidase ImmA (M78 family)
MFEYAELKATALLALARIPRPPVDVNECARAAGIALVIPSDRGEGTDDDASAVLMQRGDVVVALINSRQSPRRQRFSLAHETGHWVLERIPGTKDLAPIAARGRKYDQLERVCNYFAACLLMPRNWIRDRVEWGMTNGELVKAFDVSMPALTARLRELGWYRGARR